MATERSRLQALQAERAVAPVRREVLEQIMRVDPLVQVEWLEGPAARKATDDLLERLMSGWWEGRHAIAQQVDRAQASAAAVSWVASRGAVAVILGGALDVGPLTFPRGLAAPVLDVILAADGEEVWLFVVGDKALLAELGGEADAARVDVWAVSCEIESVSDSPEPRGRTPVVGQGTGPSKGHGDDDTAARPHLGR